MQCQSAIEFSGPVWCDGRRGPLSAWLHFGTRLPVSETSRAGHARSVSAELHRRLAGNWRAHRARRTASPEGAQKLTTGAAIVLVVALLAVSPIVIGHLSEPGSQPRPVRFAVPLPEGTAFGGTIPAISVSPDGRSIAFMARNGSANQIWLHRLDEPSSRPLEGTEGAFTGAWPIWSPDSTSIAFVAGQTATLKRIRVSGGPATDVGPLPPTVGTSPGGT